MFDQLVKKGTVEMTYGQDGYFVLNYSGKLDGLNIQKVVSIFGC